MWISRVMWSVLLYSSLQYQRTSGNRTIPASYYNCACYNKHGLFNLAPLQSKDGTPRFTVAGGESWDYSYNPCSSFWCGNSQGHDVAVCRWPMNNASYEVIGKQSTFSCGNDSQRHNKPQFEYSFNQPGWKVIIKLQCNHTLVRADEAKFSLIQDTESPWIFLLEHKCACANGCENTFTSTSTSSTSSSTTSAPNDWKDIGVPVCIAAGSVLFFFLAIFIVFRSISGGDVNRRGREREREGLLNGDGMAGRNGNLNGPQADGDNLQSQPVSMTSTSDTYYDANDTSLTAVGSLPV